LLLAVNTLAVRARSRFWRFAEDRGGVLLERRECPFGYVEGRLDGLSDERVRAAFEERSRDVFTEYVAEVENALLEPSWGWAVEGANRLVPRTVPYAKLEQAPHVGRFLVKRALYGTRPLRVDEVVSLRDRYETYYWHLFGDLIPRLLVLEAQGVGELPIVVAKPVFEAPYFQAALARTSLGRRRFVVQDGKRHVRAGRAYFCRPLRFSKPHLEGVLGMLGAASSPLRDGRRLFVTRNRPYRNLANLPEIESIAAAAGLEVVEPGELSFEEQIELFAGAAKVVAIHGGGLANLIFRAGRPLDLFELLPEWWLDPHYFFVAAMFGFGYRPLVGETAPDSQFRIEPQRFEHELERFLATDPPRSPILADGAHR
jgi:hypothetical protein